MPGCSSHLDKEVTSESQTGGDLYLGTGLIIVLWFCGLLWYIVIFAVIGVNIINIWIPEMFWVFMVFLVKLSGHEGK